MHIPVPYTLINCIRRTINGRGCIFPMYSSYALYSVLVAVSLWSYFTNDPASAGAALLFSAYQLVWSTNTDTAAAPLTALLFLVCLY